MAAEDRRVAGRYRLRSLLGRGGAGSVWLARDERLDRDVAIKEIVFPQGLSDDDREALRARVLREARAAVRLDDAGAVTVYDVFDDGGKAYLVMEVVDAPSLADLVRDRGVLTPRQAAAVGLGVLSTLEAAHAQGVIHRDVKPSNVIVPDTGPPRLTDFGIASVQGDPGLTATGTVLGSPSFIAPEQARGERAGPAADLWGLGATLFFAVEGMSPFDRGAAIPTVTAVIHDDPRPMKRAGPLAPVIAALLRKAPAERPSADEVREWLADVAQGTTPAVAALATSKRRQAVPSQPDGVSRGYEHAPVEGGHGGRFVWAFAGLAVVALLAYVLAGALGERPTADPRTAQQQEATPQDRGDATSVATQQERRPTPAATPSPDATPTATAGPTPRPTPTAGPTAVAAPPEDWQVYTDEAIGYTVVHPPQWDITRQSDTITDFRDPETGTYLRVDWTDDPPTSPEGAWQSLSENFADSKADYREIQITPTTFRGMDAALWEYTYSEGGAELHATNLGFTDGETGFALNFQTRAANWEGSRDLYRQLESAFRMPG